MLGSYTHQANIQDDSIPSSLLHLAMGTAAIWEKAVSTVMQFVDQKINPPISSVFSMDSDGISKACTKCKVMTKTAMTDSREQRLQGTHGVSRRTLFFHFNDYRHGGHWVCSFRFILPVGFDRDRSQVFKHLAGRVLLSIFFRGTIGTSHKLGFARAVQALQARLDSESLAVFRAALFHQGVSGLRSSDGLQFFLQRRLVIGHRQTAAVRRDPFQLRSDDTASQTGAPLPVRHRGKCRQNRFQRIHQ